MTPAKRERVIKIRVTDEEFARLKGLSGDERLAEWMRSQCLGNDKAAGRRLLCKLIKNKPWTAQRLLVKK